MDKQVSPGHLERLDQLLTLMGERKLDALVTVFTGGLTFMPAFPPPPSVAISVGCFFTSSKMVGAHAQELLKKSKGHPSRAAHRSLRRWNLALASGLDGQETKDWLTVRRRGINRCPLPS
jgi:hypothetical protein